MSEMYRKKLMRLLAAAVLLSGVFLNYNCADSVTGSDKLPPNVILYKPSSNDTLLVQRYEVIYDASDDQKIASVDLYINDQFRERFAPPPNAARPAVYWNMDTTLAGNTHTVHLIVTDASGNSVKSEVKTNIFVTLTKDPPPAPFDLQLKNLTSTLVNISWKDTSRFSKGYELWKKTGFSGNYVKYRTFPAGSFNTNDVLSDPEGEYYYKIRSFNEYGYSIFGEEVNTSGAGGSINVSPPTKLTVKVFGTQKTVLTWQDNANNENYFGIERSRESGEFEQVGVVPLNSTGFTDSARGLAANVTYTYRIKAYSTTDSSWSGGRTVTMSSFNINRPSGLTAQQVSPTRINLTWVDNSNFEIRTFVERKEGPAGQFVVVGSSGTDISAYSDTTFPSGTLLYYRLQAFDGNGYSEYSNELNIISSGKPVILQDKKQLKTR
ncbi:MAG: hypothetical protein FMNOHCHN_02755 [Ignavibacteriaceae bacterium]|nr:hypothetical protein [Ignavibacteriaceae bacterium]